MITPGMEAEVYAFIGVPCPMLIDNAREGS